MLYCTKHQACYNAQHPDQPPISPDQSQQSEGEKLGFGKLVLWYGVEIRETPEYFTDLPYN